MIVDDNVSVADIGIPLPGMLPLPPAVQEETVKKVISESPDLEKMLKEALTKARTPSEAAKLVAESGARVQDTVAMRSMLLQKFSQAGAQQAMARIMAMQQRDTFPWIWIIGGTAVVIAVALIFILKK
jgi:hypothetical protein